MKNSVIKIWIYFVTSNIKNQRMLIVLSAILHDLHVHTHTHAHRQIEGFWSKDFHLVFEYPHLACKSAPNSHKVFFSVRSFLLILKRTHFMWNFLIILHILDFWKHNCCKIRAHVLSPGRKKSNYLGDFCSSLSRIVFRLLYTESSWKWIFDCLFLPTPPHSSYFWLVQGKRICKTGRSSVVLEL